VRAIARARALISAVSEGILTEPAPAAAPARVAP
jgi:hypothetical protein